MGRRAATQPVENESIAELLAGRRPKKVTLERLEQLLRDWADHAGTKLYCYRIKPEIDLSLIGKKGTNICILMHPFPADLRQWFLENHGGGRYELKFNDSNQDFNAIATMQFEIPASESDPIIDMRTLVRGNVENEQLILKWLNEGKISKDQSGNLSTTTPAIQTPAAAAGDGTPPSVIDLMSHTYKKAFDLAIQQNDPIRLLQLFKDIGGERQSGPSFVELVTLIKTLQPGADPMLVELLREMREDRKLLMERLNQQQQTPAGGLSTFKEVLDVMTTMREEFGVATPARAKEAGFWDGLAKFAPALAPVVAPLVMRMLQPAAAATAAAPANAPNPGDAAQAPAVQAEDPGVGANRNLALLIIRCLDQNHDGSDLASTISVQFGSEAYDGLKGLGAEQIKQMLSTSVPELWARIAPRMVAYDELMSEFLTAYDEEAGT